MSASFFGWSSQSSGGSQNKFPFKDAKSCSAVTVSAFHIEPWCVERVATTYCMCEEMGGGEMSASLCHFKNKHTVLQSQNHA